MAKPNQPKSKIDAKKRKEGKNSAELVAAFWHLDISTHAIDGNEADIDGWMEILNIGDDESSTHLKLDYQLKSLTPNKKGFSIPVKMLDKGLANTLPVIVCAIDKEGTIFYTYLSKKFCKFQLENATTENITIPVNNFIKKDADKRLIDEHRRYLIRICEFHKNKSNDKAIFGLLKEYERTWLSENTEVVFDRLKTLEHNLFYTTDEGDYPVQEFVFKKVPELLSLHFSDFQDIIIGKVLSLITAYKYDNPEGVLKVLRDLYLVSGQTEDRKSKIKKNLLEFSKHDYQLLRYTNLTSLETLVSILEEKSIDLELACEVFSNMFDLDYSSMVQTEENSDSYALHRGVILYSTELKKLRLRMLYRLFQLYKSASTAIEKTKVVSTLNKAFHPYHNDTTAENRKKIEVMISTEKNELASFYIDNLLVKEKVTNYLPMSEIEKGLIFSKDAKVKAQMKLLSYRYKLYSLLMIDMWRFRDVDIDDVAQSWMKNFQVTCSGMKNQEIIASLMLVSEEKTFEDYPTQQIVMGAKYLGANNLISEKRITEITLPSLLSPILSSIYEKNKIFFNTLVGDKFLQFYKLGAFRYIDITDDPEIISKVDKKIIPELPAQLFIVSFEGLIGCSHIKNKKLFKELFMEYVISQPELNSGKLHILDMALHRAQIDLSIFTKKELRIISQIYISTQSLSNHTYGGFIKAITTKHPDILMEILSKRLAYKSQKTGYYEAIPSQIDFLGEDKSIARQELLSFVIDRIEKIKNSISIFELRNLFQYLDVTDVDAYILTNIDKKQETVRRLLEYGLGSDAVLVEILNKGLKYESLVNSRLQQWYPVAGFYHEEESVLIQRHIEKLEKIKEQVTNPQLVENVIKKLKP